jgi:hypothetical protein
LQRADPLNPFKSGKKNRVSKGERGQQGGRIEYRVPPLKGGVQEI